jgi:AGZA family xanthine/uracil permease-like MFS transporter
MHGEAVGVGSGLGVTPSISLGYLMIAAVLYGCARLETAPAEKTAPAPSGAHPAPAE